MSETINTSNNKDLIDPSESADFHGSFDSHESADSSSLEECRRVQEAAGQDDSMPDEELLYDLADLFKVFGDTTRIKILYALMAKDQCVADLAEQIGATQSAVSHQLRTLKQSRLVRAKRDGKNVIYSLSDNHVYTMLAQGMTHICE
ncbi:MAG: ArsR/SmtB family transcription factor [Eggerthellaceae bacterium]